MPFLSFGMNTKKVIKRNAIIYESTEMSFL